MAQLVLDLSVYNDMVTDLKNSVSKDDSKPLLTKIHIEKVGENINFEALNGYQITRYTIPGSDMDESINGCYYDLPVIKSKFKNSPVILESSENELIILHNGLKYSLVKDTGKYVDVDKTIPDSNNNSLVIGLDAKLLISLLKSNPSNLIQVVINPDKPNAPILIEAPSYLYGKVTKILMPVRLKGGV